MEDIWGSGFAVSTFLCLITALWISLPPLFILPAEMLAESQAPPAWLEGRLEMRAFIKQRINCLPPGGSGWGEWGQRQVGKLALGSLPLQSQVFTEGFFLLF